MSPRRKQSTKDLGAILNQTVPVLDEQEPQARPDTESSSSTESETLVSQAEAEQQAAPGASDEPSEEGEVVGASDAGPEEGTQPALDPSDEVSEHRAPEAAAGTLENAVSAEQPLISAEENSRATPKSESVDTLDQPILDADLQSIEATDDNNAAPSNLSDQPAVEQHEPVIEPVTWRKSTIPFREDQYDEIGRLLAEFRAEHGVQLTIAEFVRLGLDKQIQAFQDDAARPELLAELYEQQQRESQGNQNLKHSRSRGLGQFLANT